MPWTAQLLPACLALITLAHPPACLQVRSGLGSIPADFDTVCRQVGLLSSASNRARWEAYAAAHMFNPSTSHL